MKILKYDLIDTHRN